MEAQLATTGTVGREIVFVMVLLLALITVTAEMRHGEVTPVGQVEVSWALTT